MFMPTRSSIKDIEFPKVLHFIPTQHVGLQIFKYIYFSVWNVFFLPSHFFAGAIGAVGLPTSVNRPKVRSLLLAPGVGGDAQGFFVGNRKVCWFGIHDLQKYGKQHFGIQSLIWKGALYQRIWVFPCTYLSAHPLSKAVCVWLARSICKLDSWLSPCSQWWCHGGAFETRNNLKLLTTIFPPPPVPNFPKGGMGIVCIVLVSKGLNFHIRFDWGNMVRFFKRRLKRWSLCLLNLTITFVSVYLRTRESFLDSGRCAEHGHILETKLTTKCYSTPHQWELERGGLGSTRGYNFYASRWMFGPELLLGGTICQEI